MASQTTDTDLFTRLANLPPNVIALIVDNLLKCILPPLLYFPPIQEITTIAILSHVSITDRVWRHEKTNLYSINNDGCNCTLFSIQISKLEDAVKRWNFYPRSISFVDLGQYRNTLENFPTILEKAQDVNCHFFCSNGKERGYLKQILSTSCRFNRLNLHDLGAIPKISSVVKDLLLRNTWLDNYFIPGLKLLQCDLTHKNQAVDYCFFPTDLDELSVTINDRNIVSLPPNLKRLQVLTTHRTANLTGQKMLNLKNLQLCFPNIRTFGEAKIIAPNLEVLDLECYKLTSFDDLKSLRFLKSLNFVGCVFPVSLFKQVYFPELEFFKYEGTVPLFLTKKPKIDKTVPEEFKNLSLKFSPNMKRLKIINAKFLDINLSDTLFPASLEFLHLSEVTFSDGYLRLGENLKTVYIETPRVAFDKSFRIPKAATEFIIIVDFLSFENSDFMYHLPSCLESLHLNGSKKSSMKPLEQKVKWPLSLKVFVMRCFNIDSKTFEMLNFQESELQEIYMYKGDIKKLDADALPVSIETLTLNRMGIQELSESFEKFKKLKHLALEKNPFKKLSPVRLPMPSLKKLKLTKCNIKLVSPFLVSKLDEKYLKSRLEVIAIGNWSLDAFDVKKMLAATEELTIIVSSRRDGWNCVSELSSCPHCKETNSTAYWNEGDFSSPDTVCPCEEICNESEFSLDDDDYSDYMDYDY